MNAPLPSPNRRRWPWIAGVGLVSALSITEANGTSLAHSTDSLLGEITAMFG